LYQRVKRKPDRRCDSLATIDGDEDRSPSPATNPLDVELWTPVTAPVRVNALLPRAAISGDILGAVPLGPMVLMAAQRAVVVVSTIDVVVLLSCSGVD